MPSFIFMESKKNLLADRLLVLAVVSLFTCVLLPNHNPPWLSFHQEFIAFCSIWFLVVFLILNQSVVYRPPVVALCVAALSFIPLIQYVTGTLVFAGDLFICIAFLTGFGVAIGSGFQLGGSLDVKQFFCQAVAVTVLVVAVISVWIALKQWLMLSDSMWIVEIRSGGRPSANFGQPNHLATFLCMGLAGLLYLAEKKLLGKGVAVLLACFIVFGVVLTQSRTPWLAAVCVFIWWAWQYYRRVVHISPVTILLWTGLFFLLVLFLPLINEYLLLGGASVADRFEQAERLTIWLQLMQAIKEGGLWGYGWRQVGVAQLQVAVEYPIGMRISNSHNILLDLLLWNGPLIGSLLIAGLFFWLFRLAVHARSLESSFALLFSGFILVHGMVEYPLEYAYFLLPLGVMLGIAEAECSSGIPVDNKKARWALAGCAGLGVVLLSVVWLDYRKIDTGFRQMRFDRANIGIPKPWPNESSIIVLTQLDAHLRAAYIDINESVTAPVLAELCLVAHHEPYPLELYRCGLAKAYRGDIHGAVKEILTIESLHTTRSFMWAYTEMYKQSLLTPELGEIIKELDRLRPEARQYDKSRYQGLSEDFL